MEFPNESSIQNRGSLIVKKSIQIGILNQESIQNPYFLSNLEQTICKNQRIVPTLVTTHESHDTFCNFRDFSRRLGVNENGQ